MNKVDKVAVGIVGLYLLLIVLFMISFSSLLREGEEIIEKRESRVHGHVLTEEAKRLNREYLDEVRKVR